MGFISWWNRYWDAPKCLTCENLQSLLATEKHEKQKLLDVILRMTEPKQEEEPIRPQINTPITTPKTWRVRKEMLEAEDKRAAEIMKRQKSNEELEKELIDDAS